MTAGTPLTIDQIKTRLTELGVDVFESIPCTTATRSTRAAAAATVRALVGILLEAGVERETVKVLVNELLDAAKSGTPLTKEQVLARLEELGVDTDSIEFPEAPTPPEEIVALGLNQVQETHPPSRPSR